MKHRNWNMIRRENRVYVEEYQQGVIGVEQGKVGYMPPAHWHGPECPNTSIVFEPGKGFNAFRCPCCNLRFSLFLHLKNGQIRDWSAHRPFDYSKQAADQQELKFAARHPVLNSLGDALGEAIVASRAKNYAAENAMLLQAAVEKLEKDLLGSQLFHQAMKEIPALLAEARA